MRFFPFFRPGRMAFLSMRSNSTSLISSVVRHDPAYDPIYD